MSGVAVGSGVFVGGAVVATGAPAGGKSGSLPSFSHAARKTDKHSMSANAANSFSFMDAPVVSCVPLPTE